MGLKERINAAPVERVRLNHITVGARRREKVGSLAMLKRSLDGLGLIHPIIVTDENRLVAGERRMRAAAQLGWPSIPARRVKLTHEELRQIELDENETREELSGYEAARDRLREIETVIHQKEVEQRERRKNRADAKPTKSPKSLGVEARKQLGIPETTNREDRKIVGNVEAFPSLESWSKRANMRCADAIRALPPAEWKDAERLAATFQRKDGLAGAKAIENIVEWPAPLRKKLYPLAKSRDPEQQARAQSAAIGVPPTPDKWFGQIMVIHGELKEVVRGRRHVRDRAQGYLRQSFQNLELAIADLRAAYDEVRKEFENELRE